MEVKWRRERGRNGEGRERGKEDTRREAKNNGGSEKNAIGERNKMKQNKKRMRQRDRDETQDEDTHPHIKIHDPPAGVGVAVQERDHDRFFVQRLRILCVHERRAARGGRAKERATFSAKQKQSKSGNKIKQNSGEAGNERFNGRHAPHNAPQAGKRTASEPLITSNSVFVGLGLFASASSDEYQRRSPASV
ncbi:hypothetical protein C8J57DRAFT_1254322 [Mycena rebaudengoi]|nr:hypothetical protein C8J57DRAFT_1254322 [Mycena rebaudengoi]